jgi:hypothetical protein
MGASGGKAAEPVGPRDGRRGGDCLNRLWCDLHGYFGSLHQGLRAAAHSAATFRSSTKLAISASFAAGSGMRKRRWVKQVQGPLMMHFSWAARVGLQKKTADLSTALPRFSGWVWGRCRSRRGYVQCCMTGNPGTLCRKTFPGKVRGTARSGRNNRRVYNGLAGGKMR